MKYIATAFLFALTFSQLAGCNSLDDSQEKSQKAFKLIESAKTVADPWKAHQELRTKINDIYCKDHGNGETTVCNIPTNVMESAATDLKIYLSSSIALGNVEAIKFAFEKPDPTPFFPEIFAATERLPGTKDSAEIFHKVGIIFSEGKETIPDYDKATNYLGRAWVLGSEKSAASLSSIFALNKNISNAYLWSLRCINTCNATLGRESLRNQLSSKEMSRIQTVAMDKTILELE